MPSQFIEELLGTSTAELSKANWKKLWKERKQINEDDRKVLSRHTGIELKIITEVFNKSYISDKKLVRLQRIQKAATVRINAFQSAHSHSLKESNIEAFQLSRSHWNMLSLKFKQLNRQVLKRSLLIELLAPILKLPHSEIHQKLSPASTVVLRPKRPADESINRPEKRVRHYPLKAQDVPPIVDENELKLLGDEETLEKLEEMGVRITTLQAAPETPNKTQSQQKTTPGGTRVRALFQSKHGPTLFTLASPEKKGSPSSSVDLAIDIQPVTKISFTVTRESMQSREHVKRFSGKQLMGAPAHHLFDTAGIRDASQKNREYHWAHIAAHSFVDPADIRQDGSDEEYVSNLVPSTAAANYNTIIVENFIRKKLHKLQTDRIEVQVTPKYNAINHIPSLLTYELQWTENNEEMTAEYHIYPQSARPIHDGEFKALSFLRKKRTSSETDTSSDDNLLSSGEEDNFCPKRIR